MFGEEKKIISVTSKTIEGAIVGGGLRPKVRTTGAVAWTAETIEDVLKGILKKLKTDKILLLLGEDLAYVTTLTLPKATPATQERAAVYEQIRHLIPEILTDWNWDYMVTDVRRGSKNILVFAPVMEKFQIVSNALHKLGCEVNAVEPAPVSKLRNRDPFIGIAQKKDIKGDDSRTLNIELAVIKEKKAEKTTDRSSKSPEETSENDPEKEKQSATGAYLTALILITLLSVAAIAGILYFRKDQPKKDLISNQTTPSPVASTSPTNEVAPTPEINFSEYVVEILNGSGTAGKAASVAAILEEAGFENIETGNADRDNYEQTIIQTKESTSSAFLVSKLEELLTEYDIATGEVLTATNSSDLLIIVGIN